MPYITAEDRQRLRTARSETVGELTYELTEVCTGYLEDRPQSFTWYAEVVAALEAAKLEFYRRVLAPYEDTKIDENGDVYNVD